MRTWAAVALVIVAVAALGAAGDFVERQEFAELKRRVEELEGRVLRLETRLKAQNAAAAGRKAKPAEAGTAEFDWYEQGELKGTFCFYEAHSVRSAQGRRKSFYEWKLAKEGIRVKFYRGRWLIVPMEDGRLRAKYTGPNEERKGAVAWLVPCGPQHSENLTRMLGSARRRQAAGGADSDTSDSEWPGESPSVGDVARLPVKGLFATSERAYKRLGELAFAEDTTGLAMMMARGDAVMLAKGTRVRVIGVHGLLDIRYEVRVLGGPAAGQAAWLPYDTFSRSAD